MDSKKLEQFIIEVINDTSNIKIEQLEQLSKTGLFYDDNEMSGNFADVCRHIFHEKLDVSPMTLEQKNWYRKWVICYKIIIKYNPHLLKNKTYVGNGGRTDFVIGLTLLFTSKGEFVNRQSKIHEDYLDIGFEIFMFNKQYIKGYDTVLDIINCSIYHKNRYQSEIIKIIFEDFGLNKLFNLTIGLDELRLDKIIEKYERLERVFRYREEEFAMGCDDFYSNIQNQIEINKLLNSQWCKMIFTNDSHNFVDNYCRMKTDGHCSRCEYKDFIKNFDKSEILNCNLLSESTLNVVLSNIVSSYFHINYQIEKFLENISVNADIDIFNVLQNYSSFIDGITKFTKVPSNDKDFIKMLGLKKIRKGIVKSPIIIFDTIRRRRTRVLKYLWKSEQNTMKKLKNNKGQNVLDYAKSCRGLMENIIRLFSE